jgi:hypothetical protein
MACIVVSPLVYLAVRALRYWVLVLALVWWVTGLRLDVLGPWISPIAFPPFIAGAAIAMLGMRPAWVKRPAPAWLLGTLAAGWLATSVLFAAFGVGLGPWLRTALLPAVALGALTVWFGYEAARPLARRASWLRAAAVFVAPLSFFVYATQQPQLRAIMLVLEKHLTGLPELADYLLAPLLTVSFSLTAAVVWRRVSPRTFSAVSGGRAVVWRATGGADGQRGSARGGEGVATVPPPPMVTPVLQGAGGAGGEES